ncbi:Transcription elongation factor S-II central domain superfamily [Arabidopsis thaliana x Arabidopsis arenosa]|uniref:Transcription elongation factor S-II central domain superfamily n=1 Tax=Arabidopsis thaliana x Arabidopsis arenosa TaxID=1240361 RepID=A0A8T2A511_9BRAS|nr:Transcription elongation factor S-II central domain superfamily [Arabidopsis thaliana x Arabidopsis arenosa]
MSNNLLPQPCMQMGQFINVDTTPDLISNQISGGRQDFHVMLPSAVGLGSVNIDTTLLPGKRKSPLQQSVQNKRMVLPMEGRPWASAPMLVQLTSVSPRTQYLPASFVSKNSSVSCNKPGKQTAARKQTLQKPMLLKPQSESSGSVRFKMRESLAGALGMVQCHMEVPKESKRLDSETVANLLEGHVSEPVSALSGVDVMVSNGSTEILTLSDPSTLVGVSVQTVLPEILTITKTSDAQEIVAQEPEALKPFVQDNVSYSDNVFSKDDLLQGNDLSWALESDIDFTVNCRNDMIGAMANDGSQEKLLMDPQVLAFEIEAELFKLFGGVNKKYKEKGRSLLFNLKDKSNPKLREKVMYGEIAAERLCSMSAEELASKELAEWRQAKAEEMAQMVVLQDTEVDIRSLVRKTHKGEFQVEVEPMDSGSVEVSVGMSSLNWSRPKNIKKKTPSISKAHGIKNELNGSNEGTGPINGVTIDDEMQTATGSLPTIVSLDEFMSSIDSESPSVSDNNDVEAHLVCISPKENANIDLGTSPVKAEAFSPLKAEDGDTVSLKPDSDLKSEIISGFIPDGERVWEGALQLSASTVSSVIGILRSGEKTTTKEWPMLLEIKGRVRLDAFEKFVRELPNSRSRAVMVMTFVCREECSKTDQEIISEVVDSYAKDERVGYAEPASGVELYLCPTRGRTAEILNKIVPRNQLDFLKSLNDDGLIGVVVWRRPQFKKPPLSNNNSHKNHREKGSSVTTYNTSRYSNMLQVNHDDGDDVPPGFGPMTMARDDVDDLPEFNYFSGGDVVMNRTRRSVSVRELIQKYGKSEPLRNQSYNANDNDILPEWQPQSNHTLGVNHVNGGSMVRPCSEWWSHQDGGGGY